MTFLDKPANLITLCEHILHHYWITSWVHSTLLASGVSITLSCYQTTKIRIHWLTQFNRVQLTMSETQIRYFLWCQGVTRGILVGLLLLYPIKVKDCWAELLDMHLMYPELIVDVIWSNITWLLPQTVLVRCFWTKSLKATWMATVLPMVCSNDFHQVFPVYLWYHRLRDAKCPPNFRIVISYLSSTHYHALLKLQ